MRDHQNIKIITGNSGSKIDLDFGYKNRQKVKLVELAIAILTDLCHPNKVQTQRF